MTFTINNTSDSGTNIPQTTGDGNMTVDAGNITSGGNMPGWIILLVVLGGISAIGIISVLIWRKKRQVKGV